MAPEQREWSASPTAASAMSPFDAVIFDLDGVVADTAEVHEMAWKGLFDGVLQDPRASGADRSGPFTGSDYRRFVDGRPREEGVRVFLESRKVHIPDGHPSDLPGTSSVAPGSAR